MDCRKADRSVRIGTRLYCAASRARRFSLVGILLLVVSAPPVGACPMTTDHFTYADGTYLDGQSGGESQSGAEWTTDWGVAGVTPTDAFYLDNGKVVVGDTEGIEFRVERGMDVTGTAHLGCPPEVNDPTCTSSPISEAGTYFVGAELTQVVDNHAAYEIGVEFSDDDGVTMAFGIENDGVDEDLGGGVFDHSDYFWAMVGDTRVVSSVAADPDTPYYIITSFHIDESSGGQETLRMWINGDFNDILNNINPDLEITRDLEAVAGVTGSREYLGTTAAIVATTDEADTTKTFDDFQVFRDIELLQVPRIDIGNGDIQTSYEEWNVGGVPAADFDLQFQQDDYMPSIDPTLVTLTVEAIAPSTNVTPFSYTFGTSGVADDLRRDGVGAAGGVRLIYSGLWEDEYYIKTFHYQTSDNTDVDVYFSTDGGVSFAYYGTYTPAGGTDSAHEFNLSFNTHNGGEDVWVEFRPTVSGATVNLNGLQFVPEPSTGLMLGLGILGLAVQRRRRRH